MIRRLFLIVLIIFPLLSSGAQVPPREAVPGQIPSGEAGGEAAGETEDPGPASFFPFLSLYGTALSGEILWRPDWPLNIPPDAFSPLESALTLIRETEGGEQELTIRRNKDGSLLEFPLFRKGEAFQVETDLAASGQIRGFSIAAETPWDIRVMEYTDSLPSLVRIIRGGATYFAVLEFSQSRATETWFDGEGKGLAFFVFQYEAPEGRIRRITVVDLAVGEEGDERYYYDSHGNVSGVDLPEGQFAALYFRQGQVRYWEQFGHYALQWDEQGLLTRLTGVTGDGAEVDIRYEYSRDDRGNWTERLATPMIRRAGYLTPFPGERLRRRIEYPALVRFR